MFTYINKVLFCSVLFGISEKRGVMEAVKMKQSHSCRFGIILGVFLFHIDIWTSGITTVIILKWNSLVFKMHQCTEEY